MAITINQTPTTPNVTYTNLLYAVSSDQVTNPQFQYVMDVVSGSQILTRVKQFPNPAGSAIFDPSRIMNDYLEYDLNITGSQGLPGTEFSQVKDFTINFGEEYAASISSSVVLYDGNGTPGSPAVNSGPIKVFPGTVDPNNGIGYNWPYYNTDKLLTDRPDGVGKLRGENISISAYNGDASPANVVLNWENGPSIGQTINDVFEQVAIDGSNDGTSTYVDVSYLGESIRIPITENCNWERVNFAFINNYGFWDFYGMNLPQSKNTRVSRQELTKPFVDYSSATSQYDVTRRGMDYFNTSYDESLSVYTDWLDQPTANWLTQMLESPEVFVQVGGGQFIPIVITNSSFEHNTNRAAQKTFQYQIQYKYSNQRRSR